MVGNIFQKSFKAFHALMTRRLRIECDRIPYKFDHVPVKKILNWIAVEASVYVKPEHPWGWPTHIMIEPTTRCNLSCALCPVTMGMGRATGDMDLGLFKKVIDESGEYLFLILLWDWGEPFLNPSIYEMISYAKQKGIKLVSSTNGHLFSHPEHADRLIRSGLDSLIVAVDGISQQTYEHYRGGGNLDSILNGIRMIVERKRALRSKTPLINLRFIVMRHNEHEIPDLKRVAKSLGVDVLTLKTLNPYSQDPYAGDHSEMKEDYLAFVPQNPQYQRFKYHSNSLHRIRLKRNPCKNLWNNPAIHWNGIVCSCTYDPQEKQVLGNLQNHSFGEIWRGTSYRLMRRQFHSKGSQPFLCRECSYVYEGGNCYNQSIADAFFFNAEDGAYE
jgi:radical SAM protein with 4Fe4S-binding SPASM domain